MGPKLVIFDYNLTFYYLILILKIIISDYTLSIVSILINIIFNIYKRKNISYYIFLDYLDFLMQS